VNLQRHFSGDHPLKGKRKPFDRNLHRKSDFVCKRVILNWLWETGYPDAKENPNKYGIDIIDPRVEVEDATTYWPQSGRHPRVNIHVPARKEKFFKDGNILFAIVNGTRNYIMYCSSTIIEKYPRKEVPNILMPRGEYFYITPNEEWKLVKLKEKQMAFERKENTGSLFENEKTSEKQPDFTGEVNVEGALYRVAGWKNKGSDGKKDYISLSLRDATDETWKAKQGSNAGTSNAEDLPF